MSSQALPLPTAHAFGLKRLMVSALMSAVLFVPMASGLSAKTISPPAPAHNGSHVGVTAVPGRSGVIAAQRGAVEQVRGARAAVVAQVAPTPTTAAANNMQTNEGGFPWWAWLIIALVILAIIFAVMRSRQKPAIKTSSSGRGDDPNIRTRS